ncbi:MAG: ribonuclease HII [Bacteroidales bacterium]|nr:ribonuclease HII [Bacteroidales bacterium]MBN2756862.1 ribonuclease HII [Bacteroidales bacterium]
MELFFLENKIEAGCDEAGRGCLAGPVFAAAVILPQDFNNQEITDSKKISEKKRDELKIIIEKEALAWSIAMIDNNEIDKINILNASIKAMHIAISNLKIKPEHLIIDGNRFHKYDSIQHTCIVKGDSKYLSIAAASILAKTHRDEYMLKIDEEFPEYNWKKNKAYPTKEHRLAIKKFGVTKYHRLSYKLLDDQLLIPFK